MEKELKDKLLINDLEVFIWEGAQVLSMTSDVSESNIPLTTNQEGK